MRLDEIDWEPHPANYMDFYSRTWGSVRILKARSSYAYKCDLISEACPYAIGTPLRENPEFTWWNYKFLDPLTAQCVLNELLKEPVKEPDK